MRTPALALVVISWLPALAVAQVRPGDVDPNFAYPRPATVEPDTTNFVPMPDGWLVVKSRLPENASAPATLELDRIDSNGQPLAAFGSESSRAQTLSRRLNIATTGKRLASGKWLLGGFESVNGASVAALARLDVDGNLDPSFGQGGVVTFDASGDLDRMAAVEELPDGQLVALVWSRLEHIPYDCPTARMTLLSLSGDGTSVRVVHAVDDGNYSGASCLVPLSLQIDSDNRAIYGGGSFGVSANGSEFLEPYDNYGPFILDPVLGFVYTVAYGDAISLGTNMATGDAYYGLGIAAGFDSWMITWNGLAVDNIHGVAYLGFSTGDAKVGVARFRLADRSLDSGWGNSNGLVNVAAIGHGSPYYAEGVSKDVRLMQVQPNGDIVVGTGGGILVRLKGGDGVARGAFDVDSYLDLRNGNFVRRGTDVALTVRRVGGSVGAVSVDYATTQGSCDEVLTSPCANASAGQDYVSVSGTLSWADGDVSDRSITVHIPNVEAQPQELLAVKLSNPVGGAGMLRKTVYLALLASTAVPTPPTPPPTTSPPPTGLPRVSSGGGRVDGSLLGLLLLGAALVRRHHRPDVQRA